MDLRNGGSYQTTTSGYLLDLPCANTCTTSRGRRFIGEGTESEVQNIFESAKMKGFKQRVVRAPSRLSRSFLPSFRAGDGYIHELADLLSMNSFRELETPTASQRTRKTPHLVLPLQQQPPAPRWLLQAVPTRLAIPIRARRHPRQQL